MIQCRPSTVTPRIFDFFYALRTSFESVSLKIGVAGYCWGGKYAILLSHNLPSAYIPGPAGESKNLIDAAFVAHPSGLSVPEDFVKVTLPLSVAVGDADMVMGIKQSEDGRAALEKNSSRYEFVLYPGALHGFAVRGDPKDPKQAEMGEQALSQALMWFSRCFA